jgi:hypothetical protein
VLASGNAIDIQELLPELRQLSAERRAQIFRDEAARTAVVTYYQQRVNGAASPKQGQPNYGQARRFIADLQRLLPDSQVARTMAQYWTEQEQAFRSRRNTAPDNVLLAAQPPAQTTTAEPIAAVAPVIEAPKTTVTEAKPAKNASRVTKNSSRKPGSDARTASVAPSASEFGVLPLVAADPAVRIAGLKQTLLDQIGANDVQGAIATVEELRATLPAQDSFVTREAPRAIAQVYLRLASAAIQQGKIENALRLATQGHDMAPTLEAAEKARMRYAEYLSIDEDIKQRDRYLVPHLRYKIWRVSRQAPGEMQAVRQRWAQDFADRINTTEDRKLAARLAQARASVFPESTQTTSVAAQN